MIEIKNIRAGYSGKTVLKGTDLVIEDGGIVSVIGPNGGGKSTLLQCCAGILPIASGDIIIDGKSISEYKGKSLARTVSYLPQVNPVSDITVKSLVMHGRFPYLGYPRHYSRNDIEIAENALETVGISELSDRFLSELSGGQRQKAHIAMRLAQDTKYIFLDEPITYLDIGYQLEFADLLNTLRQNGKTVLVVLHDLNMAFSCSDKTAVIDGGRLVIASDPETVVSSGAVEAVFGVKALKSESGQYIFSR